jgi:hypothetical protein
VIAGGWAISRAAWGSRGWMDREATVGEGRDRIQTRGWGLLENRMQGKVQDHSSR